MKLQRILLGVLAIIELILFILFRENIIDLFPFLQESSEGHYDDLLVNIAATLIYIFFQGINWCIIKLVFKFKKLFFTLISYFFEIRKKLILKDIVNMLGFTFSIRVKWGPNVNSEEPKIANIAEALISSIDAIDAGIELSPVYKSSLTQIAIKLLNMMTEDGYKSYNENVYTVHCTSMALYALKRCDDLGLISISQRKKQLINKCLKKLLCNSSDLGWGFENKTYSDQKYIRVFSTIWALKALNIWGYSNHKTFVKIFNNLTNNSDGLVGFSPSTKERPTTTAMLYLFVEELQNNTLKKQYLESIQKRNIIRFLCFNISEIEVERYNIDVGYNNTRSWTHMSECFVIKTLIKNLSDLNIVQITKMAWRIKKMRDKIDKNRYYYVANMMNVTSADPPFYPTSYAISTFCSLINTSNGYINMDN